ncbi:MAG: RsmB/NOP family class I SAM-dependent RNA methyltransferase [Betaproteobacteria bacterium]
MTLRANQIAVLAAAIERVRRFDTPADNGLRAYFRANPQMGQQDRALVADVVFALLRRQRSLIELAQSSEPRKLALAVLVRELGRSQRDLEPAISKADNEWLREFKGRLSTPLEGAVANDLPDWLWEQLGAAYGDEVRLAMARAWLAPATLDLRINPLKVTREEALVALAADGFAVAPTPFSPLGIRVSGRPSMAHYPWLDDGRLEVQDEGSQLIGYAVAPRRTDMVVDFCAGAGGKTLLLGALMRSRGRLYAFDVVAKRLANLTPRLARSGLSNVQPQLLSGERDVKIKRLAGKIDRVLVDAPCTGFGTLRRNPDLKWRQPESSVAELAAKQTAILAAAATLVKPGGRLVYATCSVLPQENEEIVASFLAANPHFTAGNIAADLARAEIALDTGPTLKLLPHLHGCDGFFAAALERAR